MPILVFIKAISEVQPEHSPSRMGRDCTLRGTDLMKTRIGISLSHKKDSLPLQTEKSRPVGNDLLVSISN